MRPISEADFPEYPDNRKRRSRRASDNDRVWVQFAMFLSGVSTGLLIAILFW
jgi:hypothetical protein